MSTEFNIQPATREAGPVTISIAGMSGSGKTYSALLLARGLVGPQGNIVVIDTEGKRSLIYADDKAIGGFLHLDMVSPFSSNRMMSAIAAAVEQGADCIIIDSASHEHDGIGGMLDFAQAEGDRLKTNSFSKWVKPKMAHKMYVQAALGAPCHVIFCIRQHEVTVVDAKKQGGKVGDKVVSTVCDSQLLFEMTLAVFLDPVSHKPNYTKVPLPLQSAIRQGEPLTVEHGRLLAGEATKGGAPTQHPPPQLETAACDAANGGTLVFKEWWKSLDGASRALLKADMDTFKAMAEKADNPGGENG